jgi:hypothetical protein
MQQTPLRLRPFTPGDLLPLLSSDDGVSYRVADDLLLPNNIEDARSELKSSSFTRFGTFATTVQGTYLSSLATRHVLETVMTENQDRSERPGLMRYFRTLLAH